MVKFYNQFCCFIVVIEEVFEDEIYKYGVIVGEFMKDGFYWIIDMVEKFVLEDVFSNFVIIGCYILILDIFDIIECIFSGKNGEVQIIDVLMEQVKNGCVFVYQFKGC